MKITHTIDASTTDAAPKPSFTPEQLAEVLNVKQARVKFSTPGGRGVRVFKVEVTDEEIVIHAYN